MVGREGVEGSPIHGRWSMWLAACSLLSGLESRVLRPEVEPACSSQAPPFLSYIFILLLVPKSKSFHNLPRQRHPAGDQVFEHRNHLWGTFLTQTLAVTHHQLIPRSHPRLYCPVATHWQSILNFLSNVCSKSIFSVRS